MNRKTDRHTPVKQYTGTPDLSMQRYNKKLAGNWLKMNIDYQATKFWT